MYLLTWHEEGDSGNGPTTYYRKEFCKDREKLMGWLRSLLKKNAADRHYHDTHYKHHPNFKPKTYKPTIHGLRIYKLEALGTEEYLAEAQDAYDEKYADLEAKRQQRIAEELEHRRQKFEELQAEFGGE